MTTLSSTLTANLAALEQCAPPVHAWLSVRAASFDPGRLVKGQSCDADWRLPDGRLMFGALPPSVFYGDWLAARESKPTAYFVTGINLGYGVGHILKNAGPTSTVLVLEPDPDMLLAALSLADYTLQISGKRLHLLHPSAGHVRSVLQGLDLYFLFGETVLRLDTPCSQIGPEYARWHRTLQGLLDENALEVGTMRKFQDTFVRNELRNLRRLRQDGSIRHLQGAARGTGALLLGAGPSLEDYGPMLASMSPSILTVAAFQTLPAVQRVGLRPHFCMLLDPAPGLSAVLDTVDHDYLARIPLVYSPKIDPGILKNYPGPTRPLWTHGGLAAMLNDGTEPVMEAGSNVGVALFRFLVWMGVSHVVMAGQDFGWTGDRSHATGHGAARHPVSAGAPYLRTVQRADGSRINTSIQLLHARANLERDIAAAGLPVFVIGDGGLDLNGATRCDVTSANIQGLLHGEAGIADAVNNRLARPDTSTPPVLPPACGPELIDSVSNVTKRLRRLFEVPQDNYSNIQATLAQVEFFLRSAHPYMPFLLNEITEFAWMARMRTSYSGEDLKVVEECLGKIVGKIEEMDACLALAATT